MADKKRIADMIRERIASGTLPATNHTKRWVGYGQNGSCQGCDDPILPAQVEHELEFKDGTSVCLHSGCAGLYEAALRRQGLKPSD
jgi:hypothetical protein